MRSEKRRRTGVRDRKKDCGQKASVNREGKVVVRREGKADRDYGLRGVPQLRGSPVGSFWLRFRGLRRAGLMTKMLFFMKK